MRCTNKIVVKEGKARGNGKPVEQIVTFVTWMGLRQGQTLPSEMQAQAVECGGSIGVSVGMETSGGCGCCGSSSVEIKYLCSRCKRTFYPELPEDADALSKFLTTMLAEMPDAEHKKLMDAHWEFALAKQKQLDEFRAKRKK
jgi:hypothetical protein